MQLSPAWLSKQFEATSSGMARTLIGHTFLVGNNKRQERAVFAIRCSLVALAALALLMALFNPLFLLMGLIGGGCLKFSAKKLNQAAAATEEKMKKYPKLSLALAIFAALFCGGLVVGALAGQALRHRIQP